MIRHSEIKITKLHSLIKKGDILMAGNIRLKVYGTLQCKSGKRMKKSNRIFFKNITEATAHGFRPCGHCMKKAYQIWKGKPG